MPNQNSDNPEHLPLYEEIIDIGNENFLFEHTQPEVVVQDMRSFINSNTKFGRFVLHIGGKLKRIGIDTSEAYALGVAHGIQLERKRAELEPQDRIFIALVESITDKPLDQDKAA